MATAELRQRRTDDIGLTNGTTVQSEFTPSDKHPMGAPKHGQAMQILRIVAFTVYFGSFCIIIHLSQFLGLPLRLYSRDWYRAWVAVTKQYFGILICQITNIFAPTTVRVSGDKSVAGQLKQGRDGHVRMHFPERVVCIANHQLYTDWLYMWWAAYTNDPAMHGHIYIILKASLKWTPLIGPAMQLYNFIFMQRNWAADEANMRRNLRKLNTLSSSPLTNSQGAKQLDPMWLLIFPEGTNLTQNERNKSAEWSKKQGFPDFKHLVVPRIKGLQLCLQELKNSVEYVYDCAIAYEGVPPGGYGSEIFTLRSVYFQGRPPKPVSMHWRRYRIADLPLDDHDKMLDWMMQRWREKDELMAHFEKFSKFPGEVDAVDIEGGPQDTFKTPYITTQVTSRHKLPLLPELEMLLPLATAALLGRVLVQLVDRLVGVVPFF